jgi:transcriptional regulator GlxA family with amidase domain
VQARITLCPGQHPPASGKKDDLGLYLANMGLHRVVTLLLEDCVLLDVAIPVHVFGCHGQGLYRHTLAAHHRGPVRTSTGLVLHAEAGLRALAGVDTVVVPGYVGVLRPPPAPVLASLRAAAARGARVMSICTGAFALAYAGLLDGRRAATHWDSAAYLAQRFPSVDVDPDVLYVDDGDILTSAGVAAGLDLCLHVVRSDHGATVAARIARYTVVAPHRDGDQAQFIEQPIPAPRGGTSLLATCTWALDHLHERLDLARLAEHAGVSPRTFARHFHAEVGTTPLRWVLAQRVLLARQLLEQTDRPIDAVAHACGFRTAPNLRRHFTRATGTTPTAYRRAFTLGPGHAAN